MKESTRQTNIIELSSGSFTIVFIILKLTGTISWPLIWVLAPSWISAALYLLVGLICVMIMIVQQKTKNKAIRGDT